MIRYLLDTNICIYLIKQHPDTVLQRFRQVTVGDVGISSITVFELEYGIAKSTRPEQNRTALQNFLQPLFILPFDDLAAHEAGLIRAELERKGTPIGSYDLLIGAQARQTGLILVSNNMKEFKRIPALKLDNWASS